MDTSRLEEVQLYSNVVGPGEEGDICTVWVAPCDLADFLATLDETVSATTEDERREQ